MQAGLSGAPPATAKLRTDLVGTLTGTNEWQQVSGQFVAPASAVVVRFRLSGSTDPDSAGTAWFDDNELYAAGGAQAVTLTAAARPSNLTINKLAAKIKLNSDNRDTLIMNAKISQLPDTLLADGGKLLIDINGVDLALALDKKGRSRARNTTFQLKRARSGKSVRDSGNASFTLKLQKGSWRNKWAYGAGVNAAANDIDQAIKVTLLLNGDEECVSVLVKSSAKAGREMIFSKN